jgi:hypothetical protein
MYSNTDTAIWIEHPLWGTMDARYLGTPFREVEKCSQLMHQAVERDLGNLPVSLAEPVPGSLVDAWKESCIKKCPLCGSTLVDLSVLGQPGLVCPNPNCGVAIDRAAVE